MPHYFDLQSKINITMKRILSFLYVASVAALVSCAESGLKISVTNPLAIDRGPETVEVAWSSIASRLEGVTPDNVVVLDLEGRQIPSQVVYEGFDEPQLLIFQATVAASDASEYTIRTGKRDDYKVQAAGRHVPERFDDYTWENNIVAYRLYGPALETAAEGALVSPGMDIWSKRTPEMVIDKWYGDGHYHTDSGEGMDCYKVGPTLGGGSSAPLVDGEMCLSRNYEQWERLDNGPVRTSVRLSYAPFAAGKDTVSLVKTVTLDANTRFNKITNVYSGQKGVLQVVSGVVLHKDAQTWFGENALAVTEPASDSKNPVEDGDISLGIVLPGAKNISEIGGHAVAMTEVVSGEPFTFWSGAGWSKGGVSDTVQWRQVVEQTALLITNPLGVLIR